MKKSVKDLQPHSVVKRVFNNFSYKEEDYYKLMAQALIKNQAGVYNCHSLNEVMIKLGFVGKKSNKITKRGREYLYRYFYDDKMAV